MSNGVIKSLYNALAHGSTEHREWLLEAITAHFYNTEPPAYKVTPYTGRVVVCAALIHGGIIIVGPRYFDKVMRDQISNLDSGLDPCNDDFWEQGFIDQEGIFLNQEEALAIAKDAGQLNVRRVKTYPLEVLSPEDLY